MITTFVCSACGEKRIGETSLGGVCSVCGSSLCYVCWSGLKRRRCAVHDPEAADSAPAPRRSVLRAVSPEEQCRVLLDEKLIKYGRTRVSAREMEAETGLPFRMVEGLFEAQASEKGFRIVRSRGDILLCRE